ncbi:MAG: arginine deiminase family protein [bacterium]
MSAGDSAGAGSPASGPAAGPVRIESEIGRLRSVVIHTPGSEIESMTPRTATEVLYNDIIPLSVVSDEHRTLKRFLSLVADVHEVTDLAERALGPPEVRERLVAAVCGAGSGSSRRDELLSLPPRELVRTMVGGLRSRKDSLTSVLDGSEYDLPPLPNLYFMRDSSLVVRDRVVVGAMAHGVRSAEAQLLHATFSSPAAIAGAGILWDGTAPDGDGEPGFESHAAGQPRRHGDNPEEAVVDGLPPVRLEGGDILVARRDLLVVGISERTSAAALDSLASAFLTTYGEPLTLIAVVLPRERSTIHLDMIFTLVDRDVALVYEPYITGPHRVDVYRMQLAPGSTTRVEKCDGLLTALAASGMSLETVPCGGRDPVVREREQWLSAANVFAFAPGKVVGYDCNVATMEAFARAGFAVVGVEEFLARGAAARSVDDDERLFVGLPGVNLARGGGGPRCMTLPVVRDPV